MRKQLTEAAIEKLRAPLSGRLELFDSIVPGLAVRVTPNGAKSFVVRGRIKGPIRLTIGDALGMKLSDAREEASSVLKTCRAGKDPREEGVSKKLPLNGQTSWSSSGCWRRSSSAWRIHDLRRTLATHMEDALGIPPHIVGSVLNIRAPAAPDANVEPRSLVW